MFELTSDEHWALSQLAQAGDDGLLLYARISKQAAVRLVANGLAEISATLPHRVTVTEKGRAHRVRVSA